jgi:hypothetical protein
VVPAGRYLGTFEIDGVAAAACEALARLAANPAAHRTLQAAATFQTALGLLGAMLLATVAKDVTVETEEMVRGPVAIIMVSIQTAGRPRRPDSGNVGSVSRLRSCDGCAVKKMGGLWPPREHRAGLSMCRAAKPFGFGRAVRLIPTCLCPGQKIYL